jgi:hypothetical protein
MSRKSIISLAAIGTLALATVFSGAALAHGGGHGGHGGGHGGHGGHMHGHIHWVHYRHFRHFHERIYVRPVTYAVRTVSPGPCTCLTKDYTPDGQVVFKDLCTKDGKRAGRRCCRPGAGRTEPEQFRRQDLSGLSEGQSASRAGRAADKVTRSTVRASSRPAACRAAFTCAAAPTRSRWCPAQVQAPTGFSSRRFFPGRSFSMRSVTLGMVSGANTPKEK